MPEIFQLQSKDAVIKINHYASISGIQNFDWTSQFNEERIEELGNQEIIAQINTPEVSGSFEVLNAGNTVATLRRMITKTDASSRFLGYLAGQDTAEANYANNVGTVRGVDLERAVFDMLECKRPNDVFSEATVIPRATLSQAQFSLDANGMARETYSFQGDIIRLFGAPRHDIFALPAIFISSTTARTPQGFKLSDDDATAPADSYVIRYVMVDDRILPAAAIDSVAQDADPATEGDIITFAAGSEIEDGQRISVLVYSKTPGSFPSIDYTTTARYIKADSVDIYLIERLNQNQVGDNSLAKLADGSLVGNAVLTADERLLRAQTADMTINLNREPLRQIAKSDTGNSTYYRSVQYPLDITASVNCLETDYADWGKLQGVDLSQAGAFIDLAQFEGKTWQLVFQYYYNGTPVQTMALCNARVTGPGHRVGAGARAELNWQFAGSEWVVEGIDF